MPDWIIYGVLAAVLLLIFAFYLIIRRSVQEFKAGVRGDGRR